MPNKQNTISPEEKKILNKCYWGSLSCMRTTSKCWIRDRCHGAVHGTGY